MFSFYQEPEPAPGRKVPEPKPSQNRPAPKPCLAHPFYDKPELCVGAAVRLLVVLFAGGGVAAQPAGHMGRQLSPSLLLVPANVKGFSNNVKTILID